MQLFASFVLIIGLSGLAGCGGTEGTSTRAEPPPVEETVFDDMVGSMDKARAVQETTLQHKEELDRAIEESERQ